MIYGDTLEEIAKEFPTFVIRYKSKSRLMKTAGFLLHMLSGGKADSFMSNFVTTLGTTVYVPNAWMGMTPEKRVVLLRHERVHMRQQKRLGMARFLFMYLLWPVPIWFAKKRRDFEREAYTESIKADHYFYGFIYVDTAEYKEFIVTDFSGPCYMWMWGPRKDNERWFDDTLRQLHDDVSHGSA